MTPAQHSKGETPMNRAERRKQRRDDRKWSNAVMKGVTAKGRAMLEAPGEPTLERLFIAVCSGHENIPLDHVVMLTDNALRLCDGDIQAAIELVKGSRERTARYTPGPFGEEFVPDFKRLARQAGLDEAEAKDIFALMVSTGNVTKTGSRHVSAFVSTDQFGDE